MKSILAALLFSAAAPAPAAASDARALAAYCGRLGREDTPALLAAVERDIGTRVRAADIAAACRAPAQAALDSVPREGLRQSAERVNLASRLASDGTLSFDSAKKGPDADSRVSFVVAGALGTQVGGGRSSGAMVNPRFALFPFSAESRRKYGRVSMDLGVGISTSKYKDKTTTTVESRSGSREVVREVTESVNILNVLQTPAGLNYRSPSLGPLNVEVGKRPIYFYSNQPRYVQTVRRIERDTSTGATRLLEEKEVEEISGKDPGLGHTTYGALNIQMSRGLALRLEAEKLHPLKSTDGDRARGMVYRFGLTGGW